MLTIGLTAILATYYILMFSFAMVMFVVGIIVWPLLLVGILMLKEIADMTQLIMDQALPYVITVVLIDIALLVFMRYMQKTTGSKWFSFKMN